MSTLIYGEDNLLTRGQTVNGVPGDKIDPIELRPGQLSVHHPCGLFMGLGIIHPINAALGSQFNLILALRLNSY